MTLDPSARPDLVEPGVFVPPPPAKVADSRRPWAALTGSDLDAPRPDREAAYVGLDGRPTDDPGRAAAMTTRVGGKAHFFVKVGTFGRVQGHLLDPKGVFFDEEDLRRDVRAAGRAKYEFRQVDEPAFLDYAQYLKTRRVALLRQAERQVLNGR